MLSTSLSLKFNFSRLVFNSLGTWSSAPTIIGIISNFSLGTTFVSFVIGLHNYQVFLLFSLLYSVTFEVTYVCMYVCIYVCMYVCVCVCIHITYS